MRQVTTRRRRLWLAWIVAIATPALLLWAPLPGRAGHELGQGVPAYFMENLGQAVAEARFMVQTPEISAFFLPSEIAFRWRGSSFSLHFPGANAKAVIEGREAVPARANFLLGSDPKLWRTGVRMFGSILYRDLYPGIDMTFGKAGRHIKSEFIVAAGADPGRIRMRYVGAERIWVDTDGSLVVGARHGELREQRPEVYQEMPGRRRQVAARFTILPEGDVMIQLGEYDRRRTLYIDPLISYSTYLGGSRTENATSVAVDASGNAYVAGWTDSIDFPTASPLRGFSGSVDAFVLKFNAIGTGLMYATYLGGSGDDRALGIDIDSNGNAYVVGYTTSSNFPTANPIQSTLRGGRDAFAVKLNATGSALAYSTYFGGSGADIANGVAVDGFGQVYIGGETDSPNFPTRFPFQASLAGMRDAFALKINLNNTLSYSTYIGGAGDDRATASAVSTTLTQYIVGCTTSTDFPLRLASQTANGGGQDAFAMRFNSDANQLVYSTYLGGSRGAAGQTECAYAVALDSFHNAYITGVTPSSNFPLVTPFQAQYGGGTSDAFVAKLNSGGARLYSSFLGGRGTDIGTALRVDGSRRAYVAGYTSSNNFPLVSPVQGAFAGAYDSYLARVDVSGSLLNFSSYLGGSGTDATLGIAYHTNGDLYLTGLTNSVNFPRQGPFQASLRGGVDAFLTKVGDVGF